MATLDEALAAALKSHQAGDLSRAEEIYRRILAVDPGHAEAWHLLGVIAHQVGKNERAVEQIQRAISVDASNADYHNNLGEALRALGQRDEAAACYREALRLRPSYPEALNNLGNALHDQGNSAAAADRYQEALRLKPDFALAANNLGNVLYALGKPEEAAERYRQALRLEPTCAEAHNNLGNILRKQGKLVEAACSFQEALKHRPAFLDARTSLGQVLLERGKAAEAAACFQEVLRRRPESVETRNSLGIALHKQGRLDEAIACYRRVLEIRPEFVEARNNLGFALQNQGKVAEAVACYRQLLVLDPSFAEAHNNLGNILQEQGRLEEAFASYHEALRIRPDYAKAHNNLGSAYQELGKLPEALASYRESLRLKPDYAGTHSNILFCLTHTGDTPPDQVFAEHRRWGQLHGVVKGGALAHANDPEPERRLRVGYVSADFRNHALARFFEPILTHHDPEQVEAICYANVHAPDETTARLQARAHGWRPIQGLADDQVVEKVRADRIDILVDLSGHTAGHRLQVFAHKPAPMQVTFFGYPNTTGLAAMDYRLTDAVMDPPGEPIRDVEELVRLPRALCFICLENAPPVTPLPARQSGTITFGSLHKLSKLNAGVLDLWCRVLKAVPSSRLLVFRNTLVGAVREELRRQFAERGLAGDRLELRHALDARGHLAVYDTIDVTLDTFPYGGGTTLCEALWMGVPALTLRGDRPAGRVGASLLTCAGLPEWIAGTPDAFVARAGALTSDLEHLAALRAGLRERLRTTLCDGTTFTRGLEEAYRWMWRRWCFQRAGAPGHG